MSDPKREALRRANTLRKAGRRTEALQILQQVILDDDTNVSAWWLMAQTVEGRTDRRAALGHVLTLNPRHAKAQKMLAELVERYPGLVEKPDLLRPKPIDAPPAPARGRRRTSTVVAIAVLAIILLVALVLLINGDIISLPGVLTPIRSL